MKQVLLPFLLMIVNISYSQQLRFLPKIENIQTCFNMRFELDKNGGVEFLNKKILQQKKVSKAYFYDENGYVFSVMEFDTTGTMTGKAYQENYYFSEKRWRKEGPKNIEMISWYRDTLLMRTDTLVWQTERYHQADTDMIYTKSHLRIYLRGELINERNDYYNRLYKESLDQNFEHTYEPLQLYFASDRYYTGELKATAFDGKINLDTTSLAALPFYKDFQAATHINAFVEGEKFMELCRSEAVWDDMPDNSDNRRLRETYNKEGLVEAVYSSPIENENDEVLNCRIKYDYFK